METLLSDPAKFQKLLVPENKDYSDDFRIIGKEKEQHLIRLKESIFINHLKPSSNTKEDNTELVLCTQ